MSTVHTAIEIRAPVQEVWETIMNPRRLEDWVTIHRQLRNVSDDPLTKGSTMDQVLHMRGINFNVHWTPAEMDAPNHAEWEGRGPAHSRARISYELASHGDGPPCFDYTTEFTPPGCRPGRVATR